jgi:hypothetical protein
MIAVNNKPEETDLSWQTSFLAMLPEIEGRLRRAFRYLGHEARDEAVREAVAHSMFAYIRLYDKGRAAVASSSSLAFYSSRQVKRGRPAAGRMNGKDVLSRYAQIGNRIRIERQPNKWIDAIVQDKRAPVADQVAVKMDVGEWFARLSGRMKQIAKDLAFGYSTFEASQKYGVTPGRISQLRRSLEKSWAEFQSDAELMHT